MMPLLGLPADNAINILLKFTFTDDVSGEIFVGGKR